MVKGKLAKNRRKRKINYPLENKIKILSVEDLKKDDIQSKFNAGCLLVLTGIDQNKQLIYRIEDNFSYNKVLLLASRESPRIKISKFMLDPFGDPLSSGYKLSDLMYIGQDHPEYKGLNRRLEIINQN